MTDKTEAMDNLIAQDADLIETLLEVGRDGVWKSGHNPATAHPMCVKAAYRIEAQAAEIEKLEALFTNATYEARAMMEEIERLRAELNGWREMAGKAEQWNT